MLISYKWLNDYLQIKKNGKPVEINPDELESILTETGLEVESVTPFESIKGGLEGLVIGEVLSVEKHPDADRLTLAKVLYADEPVDIVCGAPNVKAGQKVVVAPVNTTIFPIKGEPFKIKKAKIRGIASYGMICAEDEIGIGENHDGIIELPRDVEVGIDAKSYYKPETDWIFDIALTPNRSDAHSHIGVARDIAAYLKINSDYDVALINPAIPEPAITENKLPIDVTIENTKACPRYAGIVLSGITVKPSPEWMKKKLIAIGVKPINNVVDITNFILHEYGQPLHAFDYDKIKGHKIIVKTSRDEAQFKTLDGDTRKLHRDDLVICDQKNAMCIGGVYGGFDSGVKDETTTIFLESAYFDPVFIRKTAMRHNLRTDAAMRFEKGIDPQMAVTALKRAVSLLSEYAAAMTASPVIDVYPNPVKPATVKLSIAYVHTLCGEKIPVETMISIFEALGIEILDRNENEMTVEVPTFKTEVTRPADLVEELLRIYGFNNISIQSEFRPVIKVDMDRDINKYREIAANYLADTGFNEMVSWSFARSELLQKAGMSNETDVRLFNPLSADLDTMRPGLMSSVMQVVQYNHNRKNIDLKLFELGRSYHKINGQFDEREHLVLAMTGNVQPESWENENTTVDFYTLKSRVVNLLRKLGLEKYTFQPLEDNHFEYGLTASSYQGDIVKLGLVRKELAKVFGIKKEVWFADFDWQVIEKEIANKKTRFEPISKYPAIRRDLAMIADDNIEYAALKLFAQKIGGKLLKEVHLFDIYKDKKLGEGKISYALSFVFQDKTKTLTDRGIDVIMNKLIAGYEKEFDVNIRK
jgi:phenylalanyl-tRNA synthetase beta chain